MKFTILVAVLVILGASARGIRRFDHTAECFHGLQGLSSIIPQAMEHANQFDINALIQDAEKAKLLFQTKLTNCATSQWLQFVNKTALAGPAECIQAVLALVPEIQQLFEDLNAGNLTAIISDIQRLVPLAQNAIQTCANSTKQLNGQNLLNYFNTESCRAVANEGFPVIANLVRALERGQTQEAVHLAPRAIGHFMHILQECSRDRETTSNFNFFEEPPRPAKCAQYIGEVLGHAPEILIEFQKGNSQEVARLFTAAAPSISFMVASCMEEFNTINMNDYLNSTTFERHGTCFQPLFSLVPEVMSFATTDDLVKKIDALMKIVPKLGQIQFACANANIKFDELINKNEDMKCMTKMMETQRLYQILGMYLGSGQVKELKHQIPKFVGMFFDAVKTCTKKERRLF